MMNEFLHLVKYTLFFSQSHLSSTPVSIFQFWLRGISINVYRLCQNLSLTLSSLFDFNAKPLSLVPAPKKRSHWAVNLARVTLKFPHTKFSGPTFSCLQTTQDFVHPCALPGTCADHKEIFEQLLGINSQPSLITKIGFLPTHHPRNAHPTPPDFPLTAHIKRVQTAPSSPGLCCHQTAPFSSPFAFRTPHQVVIS